MFEMKLEPWEKIGDRFDALKPLMIAGANPVLTGAPETGKLYRIYPEHCVSGNGSPYHGNMRVGREAEKLIVYFNGGGVAFDEYSTARPWNAFTEHIADTYYSNDGEWFGDFFIRQGIDSAREDNPFREWSMINLLYTNGDFHSGDGEYPYTAQDGSQRLMPFHGYRNAMETISLAKKYLPEPDTLLIAGSSAGGFGAAQLAEDIIEAFPSAGNITVCVDSSLLFSERWETIQRELWHTPEHIRRRTKGDNLTLDNLCALHEKHPKVKILFLCSARDALLVTAQSALDGKGQTHSREGGVRFQSDLKNMCKHLADEITDAGLYIFTGPMDAPGYDEDALTLHCALNNPFLFDHDEEGVSIKNWLIGAVQGDVRRLGLAHLNEQEERSHAPDKAH